jgi:cellobionic acid phosphorylase
MGMSYLDAKVAWNAFLHALSQQGRTLAMPDGVPLVEGAELKYINQIPHTDHCVWLPVYLKACFDETNDYVILRESVAERHGRTFTAFERITAAMRWLLQGRDHRGLIYVAQGYWCDPVNMIGNAFASSRNCRFVVKSPKPPVNL